MEGSIVFYTYGSTLELNGQQFTAGMLTADLLNLSPDEYRPMSKRMKRITSLRAWRFHHLLGLLFQPRVGLAILYCRGLLPDIPSSGGGRRHAKRRRAVR